MKRKFRCPREVKRADGQQIFEVEADNLQDAIEMFKNGQSELVETELTVEHLGPYEIDSIWVHDE